WDWRTPVAVTHDGTNDGALTDVTAVSFAQEGFDSGLGYLSYYLRQATQSWQTLTGAAPSEVDLVTHSTGGLIARSYLQTADYADPNRPATIPHVHNLVQVGVPSEGAVSPFPGLLDHFNN